MNAKRNGIENVVLGRDARGGRHVRFQDGVRGFSLIELMIVVAIIAVLSAIAIPTYTKYMQRSRRSDAYAALSQAQGVLERCYALTYDYGNASAGQKGCAPVTTTSPSGYYTISLTFPGGSSAPYSSYTLTATPAAGSPQASDTTCASISIDSANQKTALDASGDNESSTCWDE